MSEELKGESDVTEGHRARGSARGWCVTLHTCTQQHQFFSLFVFLPTQSLPCLFREIRYIDGLKKLPYFFVARMSNYYPLLVGWISACWWDISVFPLGFFPLEVREFYFAPRKIFSTSTVTRRALDTYLYTGCRLCVLPLRKTKG